MRALNVCVVAISLLTGCGSREVDAIKLVIPDGFVGVIVIREDANEGVDVKPRADGVIRLVVGDDGIVNVKTVAPFAAYHRFQIVGENGVEIPSLDNTPGAPVGWASAGADRRGIKYVVGTDEQVDRALGDRLGIKPGAF